MINIKSKKTAFTLIELLIAMVMLSLFLTTVMTSYIRLVGAQRDANSTRKIYAEASFVMDVLTDDIRSHAVDWGCYAGDFWNGVFSECSNYDPGASGLDSINGSVHILSLLDQSQLKRVQYYFDIDQKRLLVRREQRQVDEDGVFSNWEADREAGFALDQFAPFGTENVKVEDVLFVVTPHDNRLQSDDDPTNDPDNISQDVYQYQPAVMVVMAFSAPSPDRPGGKIRFVLQTSVSSRVY